MTAMETKTSPAVIKAAERLLERFPEQVHEIREHRGEVTVDVDASRVRTLIRALRDDEELPFDFLVDITAVDYLDYDDGPRYGLKYHLLSQSRNKRIRVSARVDDPDPRVRSLCDLWPSANWLEREVFEMFGIVFEGHPNLKRLLTPDYTEGHPLRKDYPTDGLGERDLFDQPALTPEDVMKKRPEPASGDLD